MKDSSMTDQDKIRLNNLIRIGHALLDRIEANLEYVTARVEAKRAGINMDAWED